MTVSGTALGAWMVLGQGQGDAGLIQLVIFGIVVLVMVIGGAIKKVREKQQSEQAAWGRTPHEEQPTQKEKLSEVRQFFEQMQQREKPKTVGTRGHAEEVRRRRPVVVEQEVEGSEGPAGQEGKTVAEYLKEEETAAKPTSQATKKEAAEAIGLERVMRDERFSSGARAIVLMEIMGAPRSLRPYRVTSDER